MRRRLPAAAVARPHATRPEPMQPADLRAELDHHRTRAEMLGRRVVQLSALRDQVRRYLLGYIDRAELRRALDVCEGEGRGFTTEGTR